MLRYDKFLNIYLDPIVVKSQNIKNEEKNSLNSPRGKTLPSKELE